MAFDFLVFRARAMELGLYCNESIAAKTSFRFDGFTCSYPLSTFETVPTDTPAREATSFIVAIIYNNKIKSAVCQAVFNNNYVIRDIRDRDFKYPTKLRKNSLRKNSVDIAQKS